MKLPKPSHYGTRTIDYDKPNQHGWYVESSGKGHSPYRKGSRLSESELKKWYRRKLRNAERIQRESEWN